MNKNASADQLRMEMVNQYPPLQWSVVGKLEATSYCGVGNSFWSMDGRRTSSHVDVEVFGGGGHVCASRKARLNNLIRNVGGEGHVSGAPVFRPIGSEHRQRIVLSTSCSL